MNQETQKYFNEVKGNFKKNLKLITAIFAAIVIALWFNCSGPSKTTKVTVPETKGVFTPKKPSHQTINSLDQFIDIDKKASNNQMKKQSQKEDIFLQNQIDSLLSLNTELLNKYQEANDQERTSIFTEIAKPKYFNKNFEDENINLQINGIVSNGEVQMVMPSYTIKPKTIETPKQKEVKYRILIGAAAGVNKDLNQGVLKSGLAFQKANGKQFELEYLKVNNNQFYLVGIKIPLLTIKK